MVSPDKTLLLMVDGVFPNLSEIVVKSHFGNYTIRFCSVRNENEADAFFLVDKSLEEDVSLPRDKCLFISATEVNKTLRTVENVIVHLSSKGMTKGNKLIVIGGGFLQDIGTIVASLYMRGVSWVYVPTTLAAMADSCMGGKSSINAQGVKNLVGNFYPPKIILINPNYILTLPKIEVIAGLSEIIKICFAHSPTNFNECERLISEWLVSENVDVLTEIISLSLHSKKYFVEIDEFDTGIRRILNFGHSFGHALEVASSYKIPHGVAVLIGMIAASQHPKSKSSRMTHQLIAWCLFLIKLAGEDMIDELSTVDYVIFSTSLVKDKKNSNANLKLILPLEFGLEVVEIPFENNAIEQATEALRSAIEMIMNEIR